MSYSQQIPFSSKTRASPLWDAQALSRLGYPARRAKPSAALPFSMRAPGNAPRRAAREPLRPRAVGERSTTGSPRRPNWGRRVALDRRRRPDRRRGCSPRRDVAAAEDWSPARRQGDGVGSINDGERLLVTVYATAGSPADPSLAQIVCVAGPNWVVTLHDEKVEAVEEFGEHASGSGQVGVLDAPAFVATLLDWVVAGYVRAFEQVEAELEELDAEAMAQPPADAQAALGQLVTLRRTIGQLRRALAPHREIVRRSRTLSSTRCRPRSPPSGSPSSRNGSTPPSPPRATRRTP